MIKFMILFRQPEDMEQFENVYNDFLALVERMPDIKRRQVINVIGSPQGQARYYRILEVYYETMTHLQQSLTTPAGQEAGGELRRFPKDSFDLLFADVYEEDGGTTE
jgi:uncharacterized protein (TIGR02118 family)